MGPPIGGSTALGELEGVRRGDRSYEHDSGEIVLCLSVSERYP